MCSQVTHWACSAANKTLPSALKFLPSHWYPAPLFIPRCHVCHLKNDGRLVGNRVDDEDEMQGLIWFLTMSEATTYKEEGPAVKGLYKTTVSREKGRQRLVAGLA